MKIISSTYIIDNGVSLTISISQTLDGKDWVYRKSCSGETATNIWNQWGTDNDDAIIALILALP